MSAGDLGWSRPARISSPSHASIRPRRVAGSRTPAMNSTWSTQTRRKNSQNSVRATSLSAPRPSKSLRRGFRSTAVEHRLDFDVRPRLELERALCRVRGIVGAKRALDVDRVGVVALDEVAVVAVHRPDEGSDFRAHVRVKLCRQPMRLGRQVDGEVFEAASVCAVRGRQHGLHAGDRLTVVSWLALGQHRYCRIQCRIT